jgi:hypothetical protein
MEFAHRVPIACEASEATIVHGFNPAAVRPLCHRAICVSAQFLPLGGVTFLGNLPDYAAWGMKLLSNGRSCFQTAQRMRAILFASAIVARLW